MELKSDPVETLIQAAGRRIEPPADAYRAVLAVATAAFRAKTARRRQARWLVAASLAASVVLAVMVVARWNTPAGRGEIATIERVIGGVEIEEGGEWRELAESPGSLGTGRSLRTGQDGRVALALAGGTSLRLAGETQVMVDAPGRLYVRQGTIYVDSGARPSASGIEVVTPAGTARDIGTQFELQVAGARLRLRVREGSVALDRGGKSLTGSAGEQIVIDDFGGISRGTIAPDAQEWEWAEAVAPMPDIDGRPASELIAWVARETGQRLRYESAAVEERAATVILHGNIRHLPPLAALEAMLATTDLECVLDGDTMEIRARSEHRPDP